MQKTTKYIALALVAIGGFLAGEELYARTHQDDPHQEQILIAENTSDGIWEGTKNVTSDVWEGTKNVASDVWDGTKKVTSDVWDGTKEVGSDIKEGIEDDVKKDHKVHEDTHETDN